MPKQNSIFVTAAVTALMPLLTLNAMAEEPGLSIQLAMMDMMPMGNATAQQPAPSSAMPGMMGMMPMEGDDAMQMQQPAQGGAMPSMPGMPATQPPAAGGSSGSGMLGQSQMPMGQMPQQPMTMCSMMQNMMRMGAAQQAMPTMQNGASSGATMDMGTGAMADSAQPMGSSAARLEGRIAFLRTELHITDAQVPAWDSFANTLRAGRDHLDAARAALQDGATATDPMARLESYENHLKARTEAIHMTRMAFNTLFGQLDDAQKRMATTTMLPFIGSF
ncbi:Spy/CpxP family protein refolding chaperone [Skermanella mucosa]|uniref:Spy/CpxP family protein refolding chaperone n=1 Tax=Skermanella mucosa TaxID=1789672 RepID=UPI00192CAD85|nr:Spy/CpxP family protein refolding chaperone [Skermanella mucosa]UEM21334.1 Spy/CpxP family protein refolding chaperone [Skermanella mucosa]